MITSQQQYPQHDLFAALSVNKFSDMIFMLEHRINLLVKHRHDYPMWPHHDGNPDEWEEYVHQPLRKAYYGVVVLLIHTLRDLKKAI